VLKNSKWKIIQGRLEKKFKHEFKSFIQLEDQSLHLSIMRIIWQKEEQRVIFEKKFSEKIKTHIVDD